MRTCTVCSETKEIDAFSFRNKETGRRHRACKSCVAAYGRSHYSANRPTYIDRNNQQSRSRTRALKVQVWQYLMEHPCVDCCEADPLVLDFDHIDPSKKRKTIYMLVHQAYSLSTILAEIGECEVRCTNCHRRRTAAQFGWAKQGFRNPGLNGRGRPYPKPPRGFAVRAPLQPIR